MWYLLWFQYRIHFLTLFSQCCMQYRDKLDRVITALECNQKKNITEATSSLTGHKYSWEWHRKIPDYTSILQTDHTRLKLVCFTKGLFYLDIYH